MHLWIAPKIESLWSKRLSLILKELELACLGMPLLLNYKEGGSFCYDVEGWLLSSVAIIIIWLYRSLLVDACNHHSPASHNGGGGGRGKSLSPPQFSSSTSGNISCSV